MKFNFVLFLRILRDRRFSMFAYFLGSMLLVWSFVAMYPSIAAQAEEFTALLENYPQGFMDALGVDSPSFDTFENFLTLEYFSIMWPLLAIFFVLSFARSTFARPLETGRLSLLLSFPLSRARLFLETISAGIVGLVLFAFVSLFFVIIPAKIHDVALNVKAYVPLFILSVALLLFLYALSVFVSIMTARVGRTSLIVGAIVFLMYIASVVPRLVESLDWLKYCSLFHYFDYTRALIEGEYLWSFIGLFTGLAVVLFAAAFFVFSRRDL